MLTQSTKLLVVLATGNFLSILNGFVLIGFLPILQAEFGLTATESGMIVAAFTATYVVVSPILGWVSSKLGYRASLATAMGLCAISALMAVFAPTVGLLTASRVVSAMGSAFYTPTAAALAISEAGDSGRGRALSAIFAGASIAQILGIPVGAILATLFGWRAAFMMVAVLAAIMIIALLLLVKTHSKPAPIQFRHFGAVFRVPGVSQILLLSCCSAFTTSVIFTFMAGIFELRAGATDATLPIFLSLVGCGTLVGTFIVGGAIDRIGPLKVLAIQVFLSALCIGPLTYFDVPVAIGMTLAVLIGAFMFTKMPPIQHRLSTLARDFTHLIFPINASMSYLGTALGPLVGGLVIDTLGWTWLGPIDAVLLVLIGVWVLHIHRKGAASAGPDRPN